NVETAQNKVATAQQEVDSLKIQVQDAQSVATPTTINRPNQTGQALTSMTESLGDLKGNLRNLFGDTSTIANQVGLAQESQQNIADMIAKGSASVGAINDSLNSAIKDIDTAIDSVSAKINSLSSSNNPAPLVKKGYAANPQSQAGDQSTQNKLDALNSTKSLLTNNKKQLLAVKKQVDTLIADKSSSVRNSPTKITNTNNYGQMYGVNVMAGYKHFFGKKKRWGVRSYAYYSFNHANLSFVGSSLGIASGASQVNNHTYGVGFDALFNFYESQNGYNTAGIFFGFGLGGDTWLVQGESYYKSQMDACNATSGCKASMNTSYFQMPVQVGFRTNFAKHSGIELGFKVPLFVNQFYKERREYGAVDVFYKRNFSMYFNYMINF
ncbi:outer membrane protein, partial [Helicobacter cetorum]|uniref:outer membrane protein n=1 Tax=Helicobacter cetorum TaxID=138563 RepID=UPI0013158A66